MKTTYSIRKDWPELVSILNKALSAMDEKEKQAVFDKWVPLATRSAEAARPMPLHIDKVKFLFQSLGVVFVCMILLIVVFWFVKGRPRQLTIRDSLFLTSFVFAALIASSSAFVMVLIISHEHHDELHDQYIESVKLAFELKQSSDDLTRFARTYAVTGNPKYEHYFRKIVAIRDGKQAHPANFNSFYWDYVAAGKVGLDQDGEVYSIEDRIRKLGLTEAEMSELSEAKSESDDLINLEDIAFNAVKGLFKGPDGRFSVKGAPDLTMARNILYGKEYHEAKAKIMKPLEQFSAMVRRRTNSEISRIHSFTEAIIIGIVVLVAVTIAFSIYVFFMTRRRIISPLAKLEDGARVIKEGDYSHHIDLSSHDEIGALATVFNAMSHSIKENISRLNATIESTTDGILVVDLHQAITSYNSRFLEIWHIGPDVIETRDDVVLLDSVVDQVADPEIFLDRIQRLYANPEQEDFTTLFLRDGRIVERYSRPQRLGDEIIGRVWSFRDVTERYQTEAELLKLSYAIEASPTSVLVTDTKGTIQYVNPQFSKLTGYKANEAIGRNVRILKSGKHPPEFYKDLWATIRAEKSGTESSATGKRTTNCTGESTAIAPVKNRRGNITNYVALKEDITERRAMEAALRENQERLSSAADISNLGYFELDLRSMTFTFDNLLWGQLGTSIEDEGGETIPSERYLSRFCHPEDRELMERHIQHALSVDEVIEDELEYRVNQKDGAIRYFYVRYRVDLDENGNPKSFTVFNMTSPTARWPSSSLCAQRNPPK